jgi:hypothetical protein
MADEPSIDEILASLDRLLNEGEGRNDEPAELFQQPSVEESAEEPTEEPTVEPSLRFLMALDQTVPEPYNEMGPAEAEAGEAAAEAAAAAEEPAPAASARAADESASEGPRRIVLTDAMMVDDIQQPLPLAMGDTAAPADAVQKPVSPESVVAESVSTTSSPIPAATPSPIRVASPESDSASWEERDIQALVDQVTDDVCSAVAEQLPALIRQALTHRLSAFIDEKTRNQDEKPEE